MQQIYYNYIILTGEHKKIKKVGVKVGAQEAVWRSDNKARFEVHGFYTSQTGNIHWVNFALEHCHLHGCAKG